MKVRFMVPMITFSAVFLCFSQKADSQEKSSKSAEDYVVEQPGTIRFEHGVVIVGKVEKPQVMIFISKEKSYFEEITFSRSFIKEIAEPMVFEPIIE